MTEGMMRARWLVAGGVAPSLPKIVAVAAAAGIISLGACGDNQLPTGEPLGHSAQLTIIAHQDDDLLLMQPDLYDAVRSGIGMTNVYVTAGNGRKSGLSYTESRYAGLRAAYGAVAGNDDWSCGWISIDGHAAEHCRLDAARLSLVFLGYPDGLPDGSAPESLLHLWQGDISIANTVAERSTKYSRTGVISALTEIVNTTAPAIVRTLDVAATHGHDHLDHEIAAAFTLLAVAASRVSPELISFRGYDIAGEPINAHPVLYNNTLDELDHYEACATGCAPCGTACAVDKVDPMHRIWLDRRYAIGMRRSASGQLRLGDGCVTANSIGGNAAIVDCAGAQRWQLDPSGELRSDAGSCLATNFTGEIVVADCGDLGASGRFFLDDEGHLWSGVVPPPLPDMKAAHLYCVAEAGGRPRATLCGSDNAPTWELAEPTTATPRATATITRAGRAVRIARLSQDGAPMLCAVETGARGLMCATADPDGGVAPAVRLDSAAAPLAIEPESLVLGDVDGDGQTDACGRGAAGLVCATAANGYQAALWSPALASSGPATPSDRSLSIIHGQICGLDSDGVVCVPGPGAPADAVRSTWPDPGAALWIADLDADGAIDWCVATAAGPACGLSSERDLTSDGIAWGYASGGVVEGSMAEGDVPDTATAAFTDIDGDGRDDLCSLQLSAQGASPVQVIACARSLGRGFGPRAVVARLPAGMTATSLWAERASPGSPPRLCAADATTIACTP